MQRVRGPGVHREYEDARIGVELSDMLDRVSDKPMTEAEWIAARADVVDVTPQNLGRGQAWRVPGSREKRTSGHLWANAVAFCLICGCKTWHHASEREWCELRRRGRLEEVIAKLAEMAPPNSPRN